MKRKLFYLFAFLILLIILFVTAIFVNHKVKYSKAIDLEQVKWTQIKYNDTVIKDKSGNILIGPGCITLWGEFPYLYGSIIRNNENKVFLMDLRDYSAMFFDGFYDLSKESGIIADAKKTVTFFDLNGQWSSSEKLSALRQALKPSFE